MKKTICLFTACLWLLSCFAQESRAYSGSGHIGHHQNAKADTVGHKNTHLFLTYSYEYEETKGPLSITRTQAADFFLMYGLTEKLDIIVDVPLKYRTVDGEKTYSGPDDIQLAAKAVFYDRNGLSLAVSPFVVFPNWGYKYGIGEGRIQSGLSLYGTRKFRALTLTAIGTYKRNENIVNDRLNIYKLYILPWLEINDKLTLTSSFGLERDTNKKNEHYPVYVSGGFLYKLTDFLTLYPSVKVGFQKPEKDITVLMGTRWTF
ncbi:MAG: hypothetical protein GF408_06665 [Candidatus Omnitrophica bacterium]|nr:hypothetical protein [Candidatus Omnitrophota bacterium]